MAETLTYENNVEQTSVDNLSEEEQDSLKVGQELREQQQDLLAGKYKDAAELEKAYVALEKKLGEGNTKSEDSSQEQPEAKEEEAAETEEKPDTTFLDQLWQEATSGDKISEDVLGKLSELSSAEIAQMHLEYRSQKGENQSPQDLSEEDVQELKSLAGGEEGYDRMLRWANDNLNKKEIEMFDTVMEQGNPLAAFFAVRSLAYRYDDAVVGVEGKMVTGTTPKTQDGFRSQQEVVQAMSDPRYEDDPAYRQDVMEKLRRSKVSFKK